MKERTERIFNGFFEERAELLPVKELLFAAFSVIKESYENGGKLLCCGNGGSAADSEHTVGELMKGFKLKRPLGKSEKELFSKYEGGKELAQALQGTLEAISLVSQTALMTAYINDVNAEYVFAQQVWGYAEKNDVLLGFSTSGNSKNVYNAAVAARARGVRVISLTGEGGGRLKAVSDVCICLPSGDTARIQELTLPSYHLICEMLESEFFEE